MFNNPSARKIYFPLIIIVILAGISGFYFWQKRIPESVSPVYTESYRLVSEKISQSAAILIHLPAKIEKSIAQQNIKFSPEIKGEWISTDNEKEIVFKPEEKLELNRYYSLQLTYAQSPETVIEADFLVAEDPKIIAIFPREESETPENSEITIIFNRPMVPLSTLGFLEEKDVPVEITPATEGRFKWITTSNLQFIPKERLIRSSHYKIRIKPGLVSMDNLQLEGRDSEFITRKLRYLNLTQGEAVYNQPISIYFNQPVDIERTKQEISLKNLRTGENVPFVVEYASELAEELSRKETPGKNNWSFGNINISNLTASIFDRFRIKLPGDKKTTDSNLSVIQIYNKEDRFDREKLWDFENEYSLTINKAYPAEGDIVLEEGRTTNINVPAVVKEITAESEKTRYAASDFFDPQGKIWVSFYEEINLVKSKITVQKLKDLGYGEKCKDEGETLSKDIQCEKVTDKQKIYMTFREEEIGLGEDLGITFEKIVNNSGLTVNREPINRHIVSYPEFKILKTSPGDNSAGASLTNFIFCSNSPIAVPTKEEYQNSLKSDLAYELNYWGTSWKIEYQYQGEICRLGEFHTQISYGLMPLADYSLEFNLKDVFGQEVNRYLLKFTTGPLSKYSLNFYQFQSRYNVTSPDKTKLTYAVRNMEYIDLDICKLDALDFLYYLNEEPKYYESLSGANCQRLVQSSIDLPERYWIKNYFTVDLKNYFESPLGHYVLSFHHPDYTESWGEKRKIYERTYLTVTNLAVAEKRIQAQYETYGSGEPLDPLQLSQLKNLYWAVNISDLEPISDARVSLYRRLSGGTLKLNFAGSYATDAKGLAFTPTVYDLSGVIVSKDGDSTVIPDWQSKLDYGSQAFSAQKIYLYTDKPIYQPTQEVFIKGIYRIGYDGSYEIDEGRSVNLKVYNSKDDEIFNQNLIISEFGTFNTKFILDKDAPLGIYRICTEGYNCIYADVQEYIPSPFEVTVKADKEEYISKDTADLQIEADYYFGVPLEGGEVTYTVSSQNYYFDRYSDEYFSFGSSWYYWPSYSYGDKFLLRGKTSLDSQGKAEISQLFDFEELFKNKEDRESKIIIVDVTVKNSQGQSVSAQKSFIVHAGEFYLGLNADKSFLAKDEKCSLKIKSVDTQGKETKAGDITLSLYEINWIYVKRQGSDGGYQYQWEKERKFVREYNFNTDGKGNYLQELKISKEGSYEAEVSAIDKKNNLVWSVLNLYVYGGGQVSIRPAKDTQLEIEAEKTSLNVGEEGKLIIKSPYQKAKALISIERGEVFDYQIKEIEGNLSNFNFQIKEEYLPNVYASVLLVSSKPEIKFGQVEFEINTKRKELGIEIKSDKNYYLPGEEVTLDIISKDWQGQPVPAEVSLAVVDLSVLALKGNPKKNPLVFFYGGFPLTVSTSSNIKNILVEIEVPTKGGGGGEEESLARKKRGVFKETAFWQAVVRTDNEGKAQVKFTLPDNLTTWQTEALGLTKDTKLGVAYREFITQKELMVVPLKPRFIVPGDIFQIGATIFNQSQEKQRLTVTFESQTLVLKDKRNEEKISIDKGKTETVYFEVQAPSQPEEGIHSFILSAKNDDLEDTVEQSISITQNETYEVVSTANYSPNKIIKEYVFLPDNVEKDRGSLSIESSATLSVFLSDALNYLLGYPYGCSEQVSSQLNSIAIVKKGLNLPNIGDKFKLEKIIYQGKEYSVEEIVALGLSRIYNLQQSDGGFAYWPEGKSDFYATLSVAETLNNLSLAGFSINQSTLNRAAAYLYQELVSKEEIFKDKNNIISAASTLFKIPSFSGDGAVLKQKIIQIANDDLFLQDRISNGSLSYLAGILARGGFDTGLKNKIFKILDNRIDIDARGAFLEMDESNYLWRYYETPVKNTALYLKALVVNRSDNPILDKVLRWLLNSKKKDGAWGSTSNTLVVIDALTDFLQWKRETESNFTLELLIEDEVKGSFDFNPVTILDQFKKEIPLTDLKFNKNNTIEFQKTDKNQLPNNFYYDLSLKYYLPAEQIPPRDEGLSITREFYQLEDKENKNPLKEARVGDVLRGHLQIIVPKSRNFLTIEDYIPAGMEIVNTNLATEEKSLRLQERELIGREFQPEFKEIRDDRLFLFKENLEPGLYEFDYYVRALIKGKFTHLPSVISEMYFPETFGRTAGGYFEIK